MAGPPPNAPLGPGLHPLAGGMIANVVTFLAMTSRPAPRPVPTVAGSPHLEPIGTDATRYRHIYRRLGERWMWVSRLELADAELVGLLGDPGIAAFAVVVDGRDCGLLELDFREAGQAELVFFGLFEEAVGRGMGRWLMDQALTLAWSRPIGRLWLHTCTMDHPGAVSFYRRSGFTPTHIEVEVMPDPRRSGIFRPELFPDLPAPAPRT